MAIKESLIKLQGEMQETEKTAERGKLEKLGERFKQLTEKLNRLEETGSQGIILDE